MKSYLKLNATWDLGDSVDPKTPSYEFALDTYYPEFTAVLRMSKATWDGLGQPTSVHVGWEP